MNQINNDNRIIDSHTSVVNGKITGLAGCSKAKTCQKSNECLRANLLLTFLHLHECGNTFDFRIPIKKVA